MLSFAFAESRSQQPIADQSFILGASHNRSRLDVSAGDWNQSACCFVLSVGLKKNPVLTNPGGSRLNLFIHSAIWRNAHACVVFGSKPEKPSAYLGERRTGQCFGTWTFYDGARGAQCAHTAAGNAGSGRPRRDLWRSELPEWLQLPQGSHFSL